MVVFFDAAAVDVSSARAVLDHARGRLITITLSNVLRRDSEAVAPLDPAADPVAAALLRVTGAVPSMGLRMLLDADACVWHRQNPVEVARAVNAAFTDAVAIPAYCTTASAPALYVLLPRLPAADRSAAGGWGTPLPPLETLLREHNWPCLADVLCAVWGGCV